MKNKETENKSRLLLIPGRPLFAIALLYMVLGCIAFFSSAFYIAWIITGALLFPVVFTDAFLLLILCDRFRAEREIPSSFAQNEPVTVKLFIKQTGRPALPSTICIYDLHPVSMSTDAFPYKAGNLQRKKIKRSDTLVIEYTLIPNERGPWYFSGLQFLLGSFLRLWKLRVTHELISFGRTYPNYKNIAQGADIKGKKEKGDVNKIRRLGAGRDFESLRDYQDGDSIRLIDWRATSRNRTLDGKLKLIVKNYQEEQDQQILFIIDSGYRLPDNQFDSALCAMLMLSFVALKHGDAVAASSFGEHDIWIPPRKGINAYTGLMNGLYNLHSSPTASSPFLALETALGRLSRRSLIVLISNFREEDDKPLASIIPRIKKQHLLLMVSFRENEAENIAFPDNKPETEEELLQTAAAFKYLTNRQRLYRKWEHSGLLVMETTPQNISSSLINKYLTIKRSGKL